MNDQTVLYEKKEDHIAVITMNNPSTLNALSEQTSKELKAVLETIKEDPSVRVVIVTGAGKAFVAGADIGHMKNMNPMQAADFAGAIQNVFNDIEASSKVFIAAINGFALGGGCELAMACDIRMASEYAKFGLPEVGIGILPGGGGTQRLPKLVGVAKAKELIFTGEMIKADEAFRIGLIQKVTAKEDLMIEAFAMARKIVKNAPIAVGYAKECIQYSMESHLEAGLAFEKNAFGLCFATQDQKNGMTAFLEKKEVIFQGKSI